jgi:hypothetical protein
MLQLQCIWGTVAPEAEYVAVAGLSLRQPEAQRLAQFGAIIIACLTTLMMTIRLY